MSQACCGTANGCCCDACLSRGDARRKGILCEKCGTQLGHSSTEALSVEDALARAEKAEAEVKRLQACWAEQAEANERRQEQNGRLIEERDEALARVEAAERERDEAEQRAAYYHKERDRLREAMAKVYRELLRGQSSVMLSDGTMLLAEVVAALAQAPMGAGRADCPSVFREEPPPPAAQWTATVTPAPEPGKERP